MPLVDVTTPDGRALTLEFERPPTPQEVDEAVQAQTPDAGHPYLATAARVGLPVLASIGGAASPVPGGAAIGGGIGAAAGERLAQWLEGQDADYKDVALQGALGAVPFVGKPASVLGGMAMRGAEAAALGAGGEAARAWMHDQPITLDRLALPTIAGAVLGGIGGGIEGKLAARPPHVLAQPAPTVDSVNSVNSVHGVPAEWAGAPSGTLPAPSLGQAGLPGTLGHVGEGALSAADPDQLAPSLLANVDTLDDIKTLMHDLATQNRGMIEEARRGVQSKAAREAAARPILAELADRLGTDPDSFATSLRQRGEAANAEQLEALKVVFNTVAEDFHGAAVKAATSGDPQDLLALAKSMAVAKGVMAQKAGATAEAGRALSALRGVQTGERLQRKAIETLLSQAGETPESLAEVAKRAAMLDPGDTVGLTKFLRDATETTLPDKIFEAWVNGLLSGPKTHIVNNISNALAVSERLPERVVAGSFDWMRAKVTGAERERFVGEAVADVIGMKRGLVGAARAALRSFQTEIPAFNAGKIEARPFAIKGTLGRAVRVPSRLLGAADDFWKTLGAEGDIYAQAYRQAAKEGMDGPERAARMATLLSTDRARLLEQAKPEALYRTFQSEQGPAGKALMRFRNSVPGLRYVLPFVKTPMNIASYALERTPLNLVRLAQKARAGTLPAGEATDGLARVALGMGMAGAVVALASEGRITGGGSANDAERRTAMGTGWAPYSVKLGHQYVSYNRLDPVGMTLGMAADMADVLNDPLVAPEDVASTLGSRFAQSLTSRTYLEGLRSVLDAVDDPERYGAAYLRRLTASLIPTGVAQVARAMDPVVRSPQTLAEQMMSRIPGQSDQVFPLRNLWGAPITRMGEAGEVLLSPVERRAITEDPASVEVRRLNQAVGLAIASPGRSLTIQQDNDPLTDSIKLALTPEDYDRFAATAGQISHRVVTQMIQAPGYQKLDDERRANAIEKVVAKVRNGVRDQLRVAMARRLGASMAPLGRVPMPRPPEALAGTP